MSAIGIDAAPDEQAPPRARILTTAYMLFSRRGIRDVGVDELIATSGVAKSTFYRHFSSKQELVLAFLQRREEIWTWDMVVGGAKQRASTPEQQLLAIFDVFDDWFDSDDFDGCSFINVLLELGIEHPAGRASSEHVENIRLILRGLAEEAGLVDCDEFACSMHILIKGSIISAVDDGARAAQRAKTMVGHLIEQHRPPGAGDGSASAPAQRRSLARN